MNTPIFATLHCEECEVQMVTAKDFDSIVNEE